MSPAPKKRSTVLVLVGALVFVLGTGLAALATRGGDDGAPSSAPSVPTTTAPPGLVSAPQATGPASFVIPAGKQALAITEPFIQGLAGYAKAGDKVNVYGIFKNQSANANLPAPAAKLVLANVAVLAVTTSADGGNATYVLAVDASQAEQVIYLQSFEASYMTLSRPDQGNLTTEGRTPKNVV